MKKSSLSPLSCYPKSHIAAWNSLNVRNTNYLDLSATGLHPFNRNASYRPLGIKKMYDAVRKQ